MSFQARRIRMQTDLCAGEIPGETEEHISLGIEPEKCTISKNLTRNALTITDV